MRQPPIVLTVLIALAAALALSACSSGASAEPDGDDGARLQVVATTSLLAEFAREVAGDAAEVHSLIPAGVDLHSFEPPPAAARRVAEADVLIVNGYRLEEGVLSIVVENRHPDVPLIVAAAGLEPHAGGHAHEHEGEEHADDAHADEAEHADEAQTDDEHAAADDVVFAEGDPHFWLDVTHAMHYVEQIRDGLVAHDPANAGRYRERAEAYLETLRALDAEVHERLEAIPAGRRKIVAFHDAYGYLAAAYGFELTASALPAGANQQVSASAVADLVGFVEREGIDALFQEPEFDARVLEVVAEETGARLFPLRSTLGGDVDTYVEMMRANVESLVAALGGEQEAAARADAMRGGHR